MFKILHLSEAGSGVNDAESEKLLTSNEVARLRGVSRQTVCAAARGGELEVAFKLPRVNGAYLFTMAAVVDWSCPGERLPGL